MGNLAVQIVDLVLSDLGRRKGFDWVFDDLDEDIALELRAELIAKVERQLIAKGVAL